MFDESAVLGGLFKDVNEIIGKIHRSGPTMESLERLQKDDGKSPLKLLRMPSTRWNVSYLVFERAAKLNKYVPIACAEHNLRQDIDWQMLPHAVELLSSAFYATQRLQGDGVTLPACYLEVKNLIFELKVCVFVMFCSGALKI